MEPGHADLRDDLAALESFVVDNDELLELEERIGKFNIFDALRLERAEIRHSNFLAWLLNPAESHGQGSLFLSAVLMDLLRQMPVDKRPLSPVELDGVELRGVEIRREWKNIDLLIKGDQPRFVLAIENKISTGEGKGQLKRYEIIVRREFVAPKPVFVLLTTDGTEPSEDGWVSYAYADIHRVLRRARQVHRGAIGDDVAAFLDHYLRLIGSRFMNDPTLDELCQRIYTNHRQALELIWDRAGMTGSGVPAAVAAVVREQADRWVLLTTTTKKVDFAPKHWKDLLPPVGDRKMFDPSLWLVCGFEIGEGTCHFTFRAWPTSDAELRRRIIERLVRTPQEFGLKLFFKSSEGAGQKWTRMCREDVDRWDEEGGPDDAVSERVRKKLDEVWERFARVPDALRPIIDDWRSRQAPTE